MLYTKAQAQAEIAKLVKDFKANEARLKSQAEILCRVPYHELREDSERRNGMSMIANLENIGKFGIGYFVRNEEGRWSCSECGDLLCVHEPRRLSCGRRWR